MVAAEGVDVDLGVLSQYGVLGVFAILLIIFAKTSYKQQRDDLVEAKAENRQLHQHIQEQHERVQDKVVPALIDVANAMKEASELVVDQAAVIRELREAPGTTRRGYPGGAP